MENNSIKVDLHVHSTHSFDSVFKLDDLVRRSREADLPLISLTDHDTVSGCLELSRLYPDIPLLPGMEITCAEGDFLFYCLDLERLLPFQEKGLPTILELKPGPEMAVIWAHPLARRYGADNYLFSREKELAEIMKRIDGLEVLNGKMLTLVALQHEPADYPDRLRELALRFDKAQVGGSDCHHSYNFLKCWTNIPPELSTPGGVISAIKRRVALPGQDPAYFDGIARYA